MWKEIYMVAVFLMEPCKPATVNLTAHAQKIKFSSYFCEKVNNEKISFISQSKTFTWHERIELCKMAEWKLICIGFALFSQVSNYQIILETRMLRSSQLYKLLNNNLHESFILY